MALELLTLGGRFEEKKKERFLHQLLLLFDLISGKFNILKVACWISTSGVILLNLSAFISYRTHENAGS